MAEPYPLSGALAGVRVLDLSQYLPGPFAGLMLGDLGADVLKIVQPAGDPMRQLGPESAEGEPLFYATLNAGKRVTTLDLKQPADRDTLLDLVEQADVLIESFRPGVLERLDIAPTTLRARNPRLILCSMSGYGADAGTKPGHDGNYLAAGGVLYGNTPGLFDPPLADMTGGLFAVIAILAALQRRSASGEGCAIDLALADVMMPLELLHIAAWGALGIVPGRGSSYLNGGAAYYRDYGLADGYRVVLGAVEPKFWRAFCTAAGREDWLARQAELIPQNALAAELEQFFAGLNRADCERRFADEDCCVSTVLNLGEALETEHIAQRGLVQRNQSGALQALFPARVDGQPPPSRPALMPSEPLFKPH